MSVPLLLTRLYIPPFQPGFVLRPHLIERLSAGLSARLTLVSAPPGFGKTTLLSEWAAMCKRPLAWVSLDEGDRDPARFLSYLVAAVQTIVPRVGAGVLAALQSFQPPEIETLLTTLLNEIAVLDPFILILDDYHIVDARAVDQALLFLIEHQPPNMHLVIATREDPLFPLARYRARGQLTELRAADLRFTPAEAAEFLNRVMGLKLSAGEIATLETRTEGWIAGLQLAALSMQGHPDTAGFIQSFTGSHHFVLDYLVEEVLEQQPTNIQAFLLRTSILTQLCAPLCEVVLGSPVLSGQETLQYLERANLFTVSLDHERRWYRYHHLFGNLLRQRLGQSLTPVEIAELHIRASRWYEDNHLEFDAFRHAIAANDIERAERLIESGKIPLHLRDVVVAILDWLDSLPAEVLDARPLLRVRSATLRLVTGQSAGVEEKLQAAETALTAQSGGTPAPWVRDLFGQIAAARATLALARYQLESSLLQARRALDDLDPNNLAFRFTANWVTGMVYYFQGERAAATQACSEALTAARASGNSINTILATTSLGQVQELENQFHQAFESYQLVLQMSGDYTLPAASEVYLGMARICYEWNDLDAVERYGQQSLQLARQYAREVDRSMISEVLLARLELARGDITGAATRLAQAEQTARQHNFQPRIPEIAAAQVLVLLCQGDLAAAAQLAQAHPLPLSQVRVLLAQGNPAVALALLAPLRQEMESRGWADELLRVIVLQAVAYHSQGEKERAARALAEALALAEPGGLIRTFVDEGAPMAQLLRAVALQGVRTDYIGRLLAAMDGKAGISPASSVPTRAQALIEPLSQRELEILHLLAEGLSNQEICARLFLALDTVKGHNRRIFEKLQAQRRTEAVARARESGLL